MNLDFEAVKAGYQRTYKVLAPYVSELIAMRVGLRTAIQVSLPVEEVALHEPVLMDFCQRTGFQLRSYDYAGYRKLLISTEKVAAVDWDDKLLEQRMGRLFGYPDCCIENFRDHKEWVNPLMNRVGPLLRDAKRLEFPMNLFLRTSPFNLVKHLPCSLSCEHTLKSAYKLLEAIARHNETLHEHILRFNRVPTFYTDICGTGILFVGERVGNRIHYSSFYLQDRPDAGLDMSTINKPEDLELFGQLLDALAEGDVLALEGSRLEVRRNDSVLRGFEKPPHLLWQIIQFY